MTRVRLENDNPAAVMAACRKAAIKADWSLRAWDEFSRTARACLTPDCQPEEFACFMKVVSERFEVELGERFSGDPMQWAPHD